MASTKPLVLVFGATGQTGGSIVRELITSGNFRVAAAIRGSSLTKPATESLRTSGVEIRTGDLGDSIEKLKVTLGGVDVLISAVSGWLINSQKNLFLAAKAVGVKRIVPCDFGTLARKACAHSMTRCKLAIHEFIKELELPYSFIDVGWWMQAFLPLSLHSPLPQMFKDMTWATMEDRNPLVLLTNNEHIGTYVARIVAGPRPLNHAVIIWEDEVTVHEAHEIGERVSGEGDELKARKIHSSDFLKIVAAAREQLKTDPTNVEASYKEHWGKYPQSMSVLDENTLENAKRLGYLDVRQLYPDIDPTPLEAFAKTYYTQA